MKVSIFLCSSNLVLFEHQSQENNIKTTVEAAVNLGADLRRADLRRADLRRADLRRADLREANLCWADLRRADLREANLCWANLREANLRGANLRGANLREADLREADLRGADLREADLCGADFCGADFCGANLDGKTLLRAPFQLNGLKWQVLISDYYLRIGCQRHLIKDWQSFDDEQIDKMDPCALEFWRKWKTPILALCNAHGSEN